MVKYDKAIIETFAEKLYAQARMIVVLAALGGFFAGAIAIVLGTSGKVGVGEAAVGGLLGALLGIAWGRTRAFTLKLQAQTALCQAQIEENTRSSAATQRVA